MTIFLDQGTPSAIIGRLPKVWNILDVGGGMNPLPEASHVVDYLKYEDRRIKDKERFTQDTWIQLEFGGSKEYSLPWKDDYFDFVWCQQVLEDIADPFALIREIQRVGKSGYIETPSREWEHTIGVDSPDFCGFYHHRWCIELDDIGMVFTHKSPFIRQYGALEEVGKRNLGFVWVNNFEATERILLGRDEVIQDIIDFKNIRRFNALGVS